MSEANIQRRRAADNQKKWAPGPLTTHQSTLIALVLSLNAYGSCVPRNHGFKVTSVIAKNAVYSNDLKAG